MILVYILSILAVSLLLEAKKLSISSVSTIQPSNILPFNNGSAMLYGSRQGGTVLYIKGTGFHQNPSLNEVYIGNYPCIVPSEGIKEETLICTTTPILKSDYGYWKDIVVISNKQKVTATQRFSFSFQHTPFLAEVYPSASFANKKVRFIGTHLISDLGNGTNSGKIKALFLGSQVCNRNGIIQKPIAPKVNQSIECFQAPITEAGKYSVKQQVSFGFSKKSQNIWKTSLYGPQYQFAVLPTVDSFSPKNGSVAGEQLTIKGSGFPASNKDKNKVTVTVDNTECQIVQTSTNEIKCNLKKRSTDSLKIQNSVNTSQFNYVSGSGFRYSFYEYSSLLSQFIIEESSSPNALKAYETGVKSELYSISFDNVSRVETYEGFFYAPNSGKYTFIGLSTTQFCIYLNPNPGATSIDLSQHFLLEAKNNTNTSNYYDYLKTNQTKQIDLQGGKYYFMKIYFKTQLVNDTFKVYAQVPNSNKDLGWKSPQIHQITLNFTNQPQIYRIRSLGAISGFMNLTLQIMDPNTLAVIVNISKTLPFNASADMICAAILQIQNSFGIQDNQPKCSLTFVDQNLDPLPSDTPKSSIFGYEWLIEYQKPLLDPRTKKDVDLPLDQLQVVYVQAESFNGGSPYFNQEKVQDHGPLINGTFKIVSQGNLIINYWNYYNQTNFFFNTTSFNLQMALSIFFKTDKINVTEKQLVKNGGGQYGKTWTIRYEHTDQEIPALQFITDDLTGGQAGTYPKIYFQMIKGYSTNLFYNPVSFQLMKTFSLKPSVMVTVNQIPSVCRFGSCQFSYIETTPKVSQLAMNSVAIIVNLTSQALKTTSNAEIKVNGENHCQNLVIETNSSIVCTYFKNNDGFSRLTAGSYYPSVYVEGIGFLEYEANVAQIVIQFQLSNPNPTTGSNLGSYPIALKGKGLPKDASELTIFICDIKAQIIANDHSSVTVIAPQIKTQITGTTLSCPIKAKFLNYAPNQEFSAGTFTYEKQLSPPTITSLSKTQANPTKKGVLQIFGSGFDQKNEMNKQNVIVHLQGLDNEKKYKMRVLEVTDIKIKVGLSGGITGNYEVQVQIVGKGLAKASTNQAAKFYYANTIQSVSLFEGSYFGGHEVQINGKSFSPDVLENEVLIGGQNCALLEATQTSVKCIAPPKDESVVGQSAQVVVKSRQISDSVCNGTCSYTYKLVDDSPMIFSLSQYSVYGSNQEITIEGKNLFIQNSITQVVAIHKVSRSKTTFVPETANQTHVVWKTKPMAGGEYYLFVNVQGVGYSNITLLDVMTMVNSVTTTLSIEGGIVSIAGFGFPEIISQEPFDLMMYESISKAPLQPKIISKTPQLIKIQIQKRKADDIMEIKIVKSTYDISIYNVQFKDISTPKATITSNKQVQWKDTNQILLQITQQSQYAADTVKLVSVLEPKQLIDVTWTKNDTHIIIDNNLQPGTYRFKIFNNQVGYYQVNDTLTVMLPNVNQLFTFTGSQLSVQGGSIIVQTSQNSLPQTFGKHSSLLVNGVKTQIKIINETHFEIHYPSFVRSNKNYSEEISKANIQPEEKKKLEDIDEKKSEKNQDLDLEDYVKWSDSLNDDLTKTLFDSFTKTTYSSSNSQCEFGIYFGKDQEVELSKIKFYPNKMWDKPGSYLKGAKFQGSSDNSTWKDFIILNNKVQRGWNTITIKKQDRFSIKYLRFVHDVTSTCSLGEIELKGTKINAKNFSEIVNPATPLTQRSVIISYSDGLSTYDWKDIAFTYSDSETPIVQNVEPPRGNVKGGEIIELTGTGLGSGTPQVLIDGKICQIIEFNATSIKCRTSPRLKSPDRLSFEVLVNGRSALIKKSFNYVLRWSDEDTWGVDLPPIQGDLIYIPKNMHLYIDQSTPKLAGIIAEDSIIQIADQSDIEINTANIILTGAKLLAGTPQKPFKHKLTFNFYGVEGQNQIPFFGNKGIGCENCKVILHGDQKQSWTRVSSISSNLNQITSTYPQPLNWNVGDQIVVTSSSFNYLESQKLTISSIDQASTLLNLQTKQTLNFDHSSSFEKTKTNDVFIGAQIAVLTRNIRMQGDSNSDHTQYGIHLTFIGSQDKGLEVKISNVELRNCGQPKKSRHCINFNRNGDLLNSYIKNSTASQTYGKFITVASTSFLTLSSNVGYRVKGHNIELKDGNEQNNVIENNLMISSLPYYRDLQTDVMVASYYISNPNNVIKDNVAAGSFYYGFLYDLKVKSEDGIYAKDEICTSGYPVGLNKGNTVHSVSKIGVRIKDLITRLNPCQKPRSDLLLDPWSLNPSKESLFEGYTVHHVKEQGLMCDSIGHVTFKNFTMAENNRSHMQFHQMNFTKENVVVIDSTFIGVIDPANPPVNMQTKGLVLPRSGSIEVKNVLFSKYIANQTIVQTCSLCDQLQYYTNNGQEYFFQKVQYQNIDKASYLQMLGLERQIIYDNDGTFTTGVFDSISRTRATVMKAYQHIVSEPGCYLATNQTLWDGSAVCGSNLTVRKVTFMNILPEHFSNYFPPYVSRIPTNLNEPLKQGQLATTFSFTEPLFEIVNSWSAPFITGSKYQIRSDFQFDHISVQGSKLFTTQDKAIIFKFAHNLNTELFDVYKLRNMNLGNLMNSSQVNNLNSSTCQNGQSYHSNLLRDFQVCISGRNTTLYELIDITPVHCRYECKTPQPVDPTPIDPSPVDPQPVDYSHICVAQDFVRKWSNVSQWPENRLPREGENVTVHCNWTVVLDVDPAPAALLTIDGTLIAPEDRQLVNVTAQSIWVRNGAFLAGTETDSFESKLIIQLNGNSNDRGFSVNADYAGRKSLVVTGKLEIYGPTDFDQQTYLVENAQVNSTTIKVNSANGWKVGDEIVLSTSSRTWNQSQKVTIENINGQQITISAPLQFFHYGNTSPSVSFKNSELYTSTKVIYLSRNIKIVSGPAEQFGFSVYVYAYQDYRTGALKFGSVFMRGVQFVNGGQGASGTAALGFKNTVSSSKTSSVTKSSFNKCEGECVKFDNAKNFVFENNVLYSAVRSHIKGVKLRQAKISSNVMIHSRKDPKSSQNLTVCLENRDMINNIYEDDVNITSNECYGSEALGFILPYLPCNRQDWSLKDNIAGGCLTAFYMIKQPKQTSRCLLCQNSFAFNSKYGILGNPEDTTNLTYNKLILVGNQEGLILRFTTKQKNNTAYLTNSYVSPVSNPECAQCNAIIGSDCTNNIGVRALSVTQNGPGLKFGFNSTEIKSSSPLDAKTFVIGSEFSYFKDNYTTLQKLVNCQSNFMFKAHEQAVDLIGSTYLHESTAVQSDPSALVYFRPFEEKFLGLEGGCGQFNCTSLENYLIQDFSGDFLGSKGSKALPNNLYFSNKTLGCEFMQKMNGYICNQTQEVAVLELQSIARDFNTRIVWPINLISYTDDKINNTLNVEKQWSFRNGYPEGKRKARVSSIIKVNQTYNLTFYNRAPADMIFQIQQKSPIIQDFAWVKLVLQYPDQNSIRIKANQKDMNPIILLDGQAQEDPSLEVCGSYKYVYSQKYIEFILTTDCKIRMSFVSSVKATVRLDQAVDDFFTNGGTGKFIDKMCVILGITDTSRLKIVGVYTGSTIIDFYVEEEQTTTESNATLAPSSAQSSASLLKISQQLDHAVATGSLQTALTSAGLGTVLSVSSTVVLVNETGQFQTDYSQQETVFGDNAQQQKSDSKIIIIIVSVVSAVVIGVLSGMIIYLKFYKKSSVIQNSSVMEEQLKQQAQSSLEKDVSLEKSSEVQLSYFDQRKKFNLENVKKNSKIKKARFSNIENSSSLQFSNPFDQHYLPQVSNQKVIEDNMEVIDTHKTYKH